MADRTELEQATRGRYWPRSPTRSSGSCPNTTGPGPIRSRATIRDNITASARIGDATDVTLQLVADSHQDFAGAEVRK